MPYNTVYVGGDQAAMPFNRRSDRAYLNLEVKAGTDFEHGLWRLYTSTPFWRMYANGVRIQERMVGWLMGIPVPW